MKSVSRSAPATGSLIVLAERGLEAVKSLRAQAQAAGHRDPVETVQEESVVVGAKSQGMVDGPHKAHVSLAALTTSPFTRGMTLRHIPTGRKVTVLHASASGCEVVDTRTGRRWLALRNNLKPL